MDYVTDYIKQALYGSNGLKEPTSQAGEYQEGLKNLWKARQNGQVQKAWELLKKQRPELVARVETPALNPKQVSDQVPVDELEDYYKKEDTGDAELMARLYRDRLIYDQNQGVWYVWAGHFWQADQIGIVRKLISGNVRAQYLGGARELAVLAENASSPTEKQALNARLQRYIMRAGKVCTNTRKKAILTEVQTDLALADDEFDSNPWLLGTSNGTVDLRTGQFMAGQPHDLIRTVSPTHWQGLDAPAPRFEQFMLEIMGGDVEMVGFLQRLLGYGITGLSTEHVLPIFYGEEGRNGKDTLLETLGNVLGKDLAGVGSQDLLISAKTANAGAASPHLMDLQGKRLVWVSETGEGAALNANQVKQLTGGGHIKGRRLHSNMTEFQSSYLLMLITNHKPIIPAGGDAALWARLVLIPFAMRFVDNPQADNERPKDPYLKDKLKEEASGILAWLVQGCLAYQDQGLNAPDTVQAATEEYQADEDIIQRFLDEECLINENALVPATAFYEAFKSLTGSRMSQTKFGKRISKKGFEKVRTTGGKWVYKGVGLLGAE